VTSNVALGWSELICVGCKNKEQEVKYSKVKVVQENECANAFEKGAALEARVLTFPYDSSAGSSRKIGSGFQDFFKLSDSNLKPKCMIQGAGTCKLMLDDCKTSNIGSNVKISSASPYSIIAVNQVIKGYQEKLCLQCSVDQVTDGKTIRNSQVITSKFTVTQ
jgi:hypothetical protein